MLRSILTFLFLVSTFFGVANGYFYGNLSGYYFSQLGVSTELIYSNRVSKLRYEIGPGLLFDGQDFSYRWKMGVTLNHRIREAHACTHRYTEKLPMNLLSINFDVNSHFSDTYLLVLYNHYFRLGYGLFLTSGVGYGFLGEGQPHGEVGLKLLLRD